jgi:hypothetical protein
MRCPNILMEWQQQRHFLGFAKRRFKTKVVRRNWALKNAGTFSSDRCHIDGLSRGTAKTIRYKLRKSHEKYSPKPII